MQESIFSDVTMPSSLVNMLQVDEPRIEAGSGRPLTNDETIVEDKEAQMLRRHEVLGKSTPDDFTNMAELQYKNAEFSQMFTDVFDVLDDICYNDLPPDYLQYCRKPYLNGLALVEFYLHDYDDWQICVKINSCAKDFFID